MKVVHLGSFNSILSNYVYEMRSVEIQKDPMRFRQNIVRIGQLMAYEISKTLNYKNEPVTTPLADTTQPIISDKIVVASILRAGLPLHNGVLSVFDRAENCFVSAYRKYIDKDNFIIHTEYIASPNLENKVVLLCDTMLATGSSMEVSLKSILEKGNPKKVIIVSIIASEQAVEYVKKNFPEDLCELWVLTIDPHLNPHAYIVPGIGDAGDLAYGVKLS